MTENYSQSFLNDIQEHQLVILTNSENVKCFKMAKPNTNDMSFTIIYADNKVIITSDMGHYVFDRLLNSYDLFLAENALNASYLTDKIIAQDTVYPVQEYDSVVAEKEIRRIIHEYADCDLPQELYESLENIDFESEHEVEYWLYSLEGKSKDIFDELNMSDFTVLSKNFTWCVQAIIWATREFDKVVKND